MRELITGENKKQFEKWWEERVYHGVYLKDDTYIGDVPFHVYPFEMQIGVLLAYYLAKGYEIEFKRCLSNGEVTGLYQYDIYDYTLKIPLLIGGVRESIEERDYKAFQEADEIMNKELYKTTEEKEVKVWWDNLTYEERDIKSTEYLGLKCDSLKYYDIKVLYEFYSNK